MLPWRARSDGQRFTGGRVSKGRNLSTAHQAWDDRWADAEERRDWLKPERVVVETVPVLEQRGVATVLDIGCGIGRHAVFLAQQGFTVTAIDASDAGLEVARRSAHQAGVDIDFHKAEFTDLPFADDSFDLVLAWNVIYHGDEEVVRQALEEIKRVLKPEGLFQGTMISKRHDRYGDGTEIRPNTFIVDDDDEKSHPHFYCNDRELVGLLAGFQLLRLEDREQREPGMWHWEFLAERVAST
jgi:tellurite methyltransferase